MSPVESFWETVVGEELRQGDYLPACLVPSFGEEYGRTDEAEEEVICRSADLIIITQTCDLMKPAPPELVATCRVVTRAEFEAQNPKFDSQKWEQARKGQIEGLHLLGSHTDPSDNQTCLVADFREIYSLPRLYLAREAGEIGTRFRLRSPFLEHYSQAFARFFMRVGLPGSIPPFR